MRKTITVMVRDERQGRDLQFEITQFSAKKQERWLMRALSLLLHGGFATSINVPDGKPITELKLEDLDFDSIITSLGNLDVDDAEKVLDDLLACCSYVPTSGVKTPCTPELVDGFIEEMLDGQKVVNFRVLWKLRVEAFKLNFDFFLAAGQSPTNTTGKPADIVFSKNT